MRWMETCHDMISIGLRCKYFVSNLASFRAEGRPDWPGRRVQPCHVASICQLLSPTSFIRAGLAHALSKLLSQVLDSIVKLRASWHEAHAVLVTMLLHLQTHHRMSAWSAAQQTKRDPGP